VFFNRFGKQAFISQPASSSTPPEKTTPKTKSFDAKEGTTHKRAVALALAAQFALPLGMMNRNASVQAADSDLEFNKIPASPAKSSEDAFSKLFGTTRNAMPSLSASSGTAGTQFKAGTDQIVAGEYEKAVTTLQNISGSNLNDSDALVVDNTLAKTRNAARLQRLARAEVLIGQDLLNKQNVVDAAHHLRKALNSGFADAGTRELANKEMASINASFAAANVMQPIHADDAPTTAPTTAPATAVAPVTPAPVAPTPAPAVAATPVASGEAGAGAAAIEGTKKIEDIKRQKAQYDAQKLVEKARGEEAAGQYTNALADFGDAVKIDPTNEQAKEGYSEVGSRLNIVQQTPAAERQEQTIKEKIQAITYHFNSAIGAAEDHIAAAKFIDAQKDIEQAERWRNDDPTLFQQSQMNDFDTRIEQTRIHLETAKADIGNSDEQKARKSAADEQAAREKRFLEDREKTIAGLIQDARTYVDESKYTEALAVIDNIQRLDPNNTYAGDVRQFIEDHAATQNQRRYNEGFDREFTKVLNDAREKIIPYEDIISYSPDWPKISAERDEEVKEDRGEDSEDAALQAQLDHHLPELRFNANSLSDVIDFLRDVTGTNIYVDWPALERASIAKDAPVTARLRDIKFSKALELIFKSVEGEDDDHKLGYTLDEGVITISTKKELNKNTITRKYDINDLLFVPTDATNAPDLSLQSASQGQSAGGGGGGGATGGGQSLFNNAGSTNNNTNNTQDRANRVDEIKKYITDNVDTNTWKDNGGDVGSISSSPLRAVLLITQTPEAHRKIQSVLDSLRASQALQVSVETRFLIVQRNYLEDIGVNVDIEFNPLQNPANPRSGVNSSRFTPMSITQNSVTDNSTFRDANGNVVSNSAQGSRTLDWISNVGNAAVPGSIPSNPADYPNPLVVSGSYVDNLTVNFLIRAVQANQNTTSLTAPRLTLFSGQRALIIVETQQAYVSDLTPIVAPGAALFEPTVSTTVATGVVLSVQATVSPDRKYVFLDLQPQLARLRALVPFTISALVQNNTTVLGGVTGTTVVNGTLQLPTIDVTQVKTSCSVPDGATLLLGGQTLAAETTREQGVPVLSKIPFLKRLFTNRATSQDEQILLILVKPTILIQHEQELKQFPQLSSKLAQ
jgi:type II secretory pathway component GspD/PulD (secretin)